MIEKEHWKILLVEDDEDDYILAQAWLNSTRREQFRLIWAKTHEQALQVFASQTLDAILVDYDLGSRSGLEFAREVLDMGCQLPLIMLTGRGGYDVDVEAMHVGISDYLTKSEVTPQLLERTIRYAIERKKTEEALRQANRKLEMVNDELEARVRERTEELLFKNEALMAEIVQRRSIERELAEVQRRLIDRTETERLELAQELHDGPMQELYGLTYRLSSIKNQEISQSIKENLSECQEKLLEVIRQLRTTAGELRPPALAPYGLEKAIRSYAENLAQANPHLQFNLDLVPDEQRLPESTRLALFRIFQVAITNVVRHANASIVNIRLNLTLEEIELVIADDGKGFKVPERWFEFAYSGHLGLIGAMERAQAAGGTLEVDSQPGKGTFIRTVVPLKSHERQETLA